MKNCSRMAIRVLLSFFVLHSLSSWGALPAAPVDSRCNVSGGDPNDGPRALNMYVGQVAGFFVHNRGDWLEQQINEWSSAACLLDDGRPRLSAVMPGYDYAYRSERDWNKNLERLNQIKQSYPKAASTSLAEIQYWVSYAWDARGRGYASSVAQDGWKFFRERMEKAESLAISVKPRVSGLPMWYERMIMIQSALNRPAAEKENTFHEGAKKFKLYYPIYFSMLEFVSPKWGGSWESVDQLVSWAVENTKESDGNTMYARLYWFTYGSMPDGAKLFGDTRASWLKMKKGFEDMMARHPRSKWNLNNFAKFACLAGDKRTFLTLRRQIGRDVVQEAWPQNISLDLCEHKYGYAKSVK